MFKDLTLDGDKQDALMKVTSFFYEKHLFNCFPNEVVLTLIYV